MSPGNICHRDSYFLTGKYVRPTVSLGLSLGKESLASVPQRTFPGDKSPGKRILNDKSPGNVSSATSRWGKPGIVAGRRVWDEVERQCKQNVCFDDGNTIFIVLLLITSGFRFVISATHDVILASFSFPLGLTMSRDENINVHDNPT
nr:hypothetical protein [Tanacetum cinerariifolium]